MCLAQQQLWRQQQAWRQQKVWQRARLRRARAAIVSAGAILAGAIAAAGPDTKAAGPDFEAAGPDFEAAGPDKGNNININIHAPHKGGALHKGIAPHKGGCSPQRGCSPQGGAPHKGRAPHTGGAPHKWCKVISVACRPWSCCMRLEYNPGVAAWGSIINAEWPHGDGLEMAAWGWPPWAFHKLWLVLIVNTPSPTHKVLVRF